MWFLLIGIAMIGLWAAEIGPFAGMHWGYLLIPFGLAFLWWTFADASGITKRREIEKMEERKRKRLQRNREELGLGSRRRR